MAEHDQIASRLGDVPLPDGLQQRLSLETLFSDEAIDRLLRGVALPPGLGERVAACRGQMERGPARRGDRSVDLDRRIVCEPRRPVATAADGGDRNWAVAAAGVLLASVLVVLVFTGPASRLNPRQPIEIAGLPGDGGSLSEVGGRIEWLSSLPDSPAAELRDGVGPELAEIPGVENELEASSPAFADAESASEMEDEGFAPPIVGFPIVVPALARGGDRMDVIPQLPAGARRAVPRERGKDELFLFELKYGEPPFVSPAAGQAVDAPPLSSRTASFDAIRWSSAERIRRTDAARLRVEDVLAAMPERFTSRSDGDDGPRLVMHGVRSLRPALAALVEIEVTAPRLPRPAAAVEAAVVLDRSVSPAAWAATCRGLRMVAAEMRSADHLTLIVVGERSRVAGRRLDAPTLTDVVTELERERPGTATGDLVPAVQLARQLNETAGGSGSVVLVTGAAEADGRPPAAVGGAVVVRLAAHAGQTTAADPAPIEPTGGEVGRVLVERLFGRSSLAASRCRLSVAFDPRFVHAYRLVGYRQTAVESLATGGGEPFDLIAGQSVRVVYEVVSRPAQPPGGTVAVATFFWQPAGGTRERSASASLDRSAIETAAGGDPAPPGPQTWVPSPRGCELLLAVGLGELASGSVHLEPRAGGPAVAGLARAWCRRGDVTAWGEVLIDSLQRVGVVKPERPGQVPAR